MIKRWIIKGAGVALIAAALLTGCGDSGTNAAKPASPVKITKELYDKASLGMNYEEVKKLVGGPGNVASENGTQGQPGYTIVVEYSGTKEGALARFTFKNGQMINKTESSLK